MTSGIGILLEEFALDGDPTRFALLVTLPVIYCVSIVIFQSSFVQVFLIANVIVQFFCLQIVGNVCLMYVLV